MTVNQIYTPSAILRKIVLALDVENRVGEDIPLPYKTFKMVMMLREDIAPVMTYERTVKEKYAMLHEFKFVGDTDLLATHAVLDFLEGLV